MGYLTACAQRDDDSLRCWSGNGVVKDYGPDLDRRIKALAAGRGGLVLYDDGVVVSLGGGEAITPWLGTRTASAIAGSMSRVCAVVVGGGVACSVDQFPSRPADTANPTMLAVTEAGDVCGLRTDGRVSCWSRNPDWVAGDGADDGGYLVALGKKAVSIAGGGADHACAVLEDGAVKCWSWQFPDGPGLGGSVPDGTFKGRWLEIDLGTRPAP